MNKAAFYSFKLCPYNPDGYGNQISVLVVFYSYSQKKKQFLMETLAHPRIMNIFTFVTSSLLIEKNKIMKQNFKNYSIFTLQMYNNIMKNNLDSIFLHQSTYKLKLYLEIRTFAITPIQAERVSNCLSDRN